VLYYLLLDYMGWWAPVCCGMSVHCQARAAMRHGTQGERQQEALGDAVGDGEGDAVGETARETAWEALGDAVMEPQS
jgi:hypothetical protein